MCFFAQNNIVSGIFASNLLRLKNHQLFRELLKMFRLEAVRAGFKKAWQERDYATIITVASKISENVLQEDQKLLMWYDQALTRTGDA